VGAEGGRSRLSPARGSVLLAVLTGVLLLAGCSPVYVLKAGWAEARILRAREPIHEVAARPSTPSDLRGKLALVLEARRYAADSLGLEVGDAYTTYTELETDTLALVLSAAPPDRLQAHTWWFPIVGHIPYRAFFGEDDAREAERELREEGFDTYLRPTAAFSTLGWFSDPLLSSVVERDAVGVVETVLHELAHTHLFVPGHVRFNESYATFVGHAGAAAFFCGREGGGPDTVWCRRARDRWRDAQRFSRFLDGLVAEVEALYADPALSREEKVARRAEVFAAARERFRDEVRPRLRSYSFASFVETPLNNATLLSRMRYYHRLPDFDAFLRARKGNLATAIGDLVDGVGEVGDPFDLLPRGEPDPISRGRGNPSSVVPSPLPF